tara:strand:- start:733 stop:972 length:240 start_codon:yes stop_codon:yes gene_type:complete
MAEEQNSEGRELSTEELVKIANSLNTQVQQQNLMIRDLGDKVAKKEVENSQLRAALTQIQRGGAPEQAPAEDGGITEEE